MEEEQDETEKTKCQVCLNGCKHVTTFVLSHVGILTLVVGYCLLGAVTFEALEVDNEVKLKQKMAVIRANVSKDLWSMTKETDIIRPEVWAQNATQKLQAFEKELIHAIKKHGWDGSEDIEQLNWTFTGSLFYSIVVITTIGYGHIAPKTVWGKIVTIFYAIIGIPLMVVCLSHIGDFMASSLRFLYWKVCCYICTRKPKQRPIRGPLRRGRSVRGPTPKGNARMKRSIRRSGRVSQRSADSAMSDSAISTISDPGGHYGAPSRHYSSMPRTTQPRSIYQPGNRPNRSTKSAEPEFGPNLPVLYNKYAEDLVHVVNNKEDEQIDEEVKSPTSRMSRNRSVPPELIRPRHEEMEYFEEEFDEYDESDFEEENTGTRPVPIWLCSGLVLSYIVGGAFLFSDSEAWSFLDSAYFCFITLTTIGFGDFVPTQESEVSIAFCSLYLLFGIALLVMSFNLVQEQVINTVKELAVTLGIIDEEEDR